MASNSSPHHSGNSSLKFNPKEGKTMMIQAKDLSIVWGNDNRYWSVPEKEWSGAELQQVSWLEVTGVVEVEKTSPNKSSWEVGFRVSLNPDAFGWGKYPMYIMIKKQGNISWTKITIDPNHKGEFEIRGRWIDRTNNNSSHDPNLYFGLYEVWSAKWKGGLKIHYAYIN